MDLIAAACVHTSVCEYRIWGWTHAHFGMHVLDSNSICMRGCWSIFGYRFHGRGGSISGHLIKLLSVFCNCANGHLTERPICLLLLCSLSSNGRVSRINDPCSICVPSHVLLLGLIALELAIRRTYTVPGSLCPPRERHNYNHMYQPFYGSEQVPRFTPTGCVTGRIY